LGLGFRVNKKVSLLGTTSETHHQHTNHMVMVWTLVGLSIQCIIIITIIIIIFIY
jgi:hypothetical protein